MLTKVCLAFSAVGGVSCVCVRHDGARRTSCSQEKLSEDAEDESHKWMRSLPFRLCVHNNNAHTLSKYANPLIFVVVFFLCLLSLARVVLLPDHTKPTEFVCQNVRYAA